MSCGTNVPATLDLLPAFLWFGLNQMLCLTCSEWWIKRTKISVSSATTTVSSISAHSIAVLVTNTSASSRATNCHNQLTTVSEPTYVWIFAYSSPICKYTGCPLRSIIKVISCLVNTLFFTIYQITPLVLQMKLLPCLLHYVNYLFPSMEWSHPFTI